MQCINDTGELLRGKQRAQGQPRLHKTISELTGAEPAAKAREDCAGQPAFRPPAASPPARPPTRSLTAQPARAPLRRPPPAAAGPARPAAPSLPSPPGEAASDGDPGA